MSSPIIMPQLGETVAEGKILIWFKSVGDEIKEGDNLFEVETEKSRWRCRRSAPVGCLKFGWALG
jgi:pyruvate/2-oxoglutarate dehydrogenase complex dihydrolipoamide acyltransferase (E2) component